MLSTTQKINAFSTLGQELETFLANAASRNFPQNSSFRALEQAIESAELNNPWFVRQNIFHSLKAIAEQLQQERLQSWLSSYNFPYPGQIRTVAVVMAGNIPLVGFHDFLSVIMSGHHFLGKLSSDDAFLLPAIAGMLCNIEPALQPQITFTQEKLSSFDAVIATGSNNTARYFEYYFGKYPNIIRKNRHSVAVLSGNETADEIRLLAEDIFSYFGLGCRNISKIYLPNETDPVWLMQSLCGWSWLKDHSKYYHNYEYNRAVFLINSIAHLDNGYVIMREETALSSPVSVLHYEHYSDLQQVRKTLLLQKEMLQCVVSKDGLIPGSVNFGQAQRPTLDDYADGVDTLKFLMSIR